MAEDQWQAVYERTKRGRQAMKARNEAERAAKEQAKAEKEARAARFLGDQRQISRAEADLAAKRAEAQGAQAKADSYAPAPRSDSAAPESGQPMAASVADRMRARGQSDVAQGVQLLSEADRKLVQQIRNPTHAAVAGFTGTVGGDPSLPVGRRGLYQPGAAIPAQAQPLAPVQPIPAQAAPLEPEAAAAPVGPTVAPGVPVGAAPGLAPGELPAIPTEAAPLEEDLALQQAQDAGMAFDFSGEGDLVTAQEPAPPVNEGVLQRQLDAEEMAANRRVDTAVTEAVGLQRASEAAREALAAEEQAAADHQQRIQARMEASEEATRTVESLTAKAQEMQAVDPRRAWANAGIGRKIGFAIQIALSSFGGRQNPLSALDTWIKQDVDAQSEALKKAGSDIEGARAVAFDQANLLQQAREVTSDENVARTMVEAARLQQVQAQMRAELAKAGVQQFSAEQEVMLTQIEEKIAEKNMIIQAKAATNPEFFTKVVAAHGKGEREALQTLGRGLLKRGLEADPSAEGQEAKLEQMGAEAQFKAMEQRQAEAAKRNDKIAEQAYQFGKDTVAAQEVIGGIDTIISQDDIAGFGYTEGVNLPSKRTTVQTINTRVIEPLGRLRSQGAISKEEEVRFAEMVFAGVEFGEGSIFETSESRLRKNLEILRATLQLRVDAQKRALPRESRNYYDRNVAGADFDPIWSGGSGEGVVVED